MKTASTLILAAAALCLPAFGGEEISSKDSKEVTQVDTSEPFFKDHEFQTETFAHYSVGNGPTHAGLFRDHSWGEGSGINYFFNRYIGLGVEYSGEYAKESPDTNQGMLTNHKVNTYDVAGNIYFRYPIERLRLAPYAFVGGGCDFADRKYASVDVGFGVEYRITPPRIGFLTPSRLALFADTQWNYLGDRYFPDDNSSRGNLNFFSVRAGFRFIY